MIRKKWFWYSILSVLGFGGWAILAKLGSAHLPARVVLQLYTWSAVVIVLVPLVRRRFRIETNARGVSYSLANGFIANVGNLALVTAYQQGGNTSVITVVTSLYPTITVLLALLVLKERLTQAQTAGIVLALVSVVIFSL